VRAQGGGALISELPLVLGGTFLEGTSVGGIFSGMAARKSVQGRGGRGEPPSAALFLTRPEA